MTTPDETAHQSACESGQIGDGRIHRPGGSHFGSSIVFFDIAFVIPAIREIASEAVAPNQARASHA